MKPKNTEFWWISIDNSKPTIGQYVDSGLGYWYVCGDEEGWNAGRVRPLRKIRRLTIKEQLAIASP